MAAEHASSTFCNCKHLAPRWSSERWAYYRGKACPKKRTHVQRCAKQLSARLFPAMFQPVRFRRGPSSAWAELTLNHLNPHRGPSKWHWNWHWMHCNASSVILCQALFAWINTSWVSLGLCFKAKNRVTPQFWQFDHHFPIIFSMKQQFLGAYRHTVTNPVPYQIGNDLRLGLAETARQEVVKQISADAEPWRTWRTWEASDTHQMPSYTVKVIKVYNILYIIKPTGRGYGPPGHTRERS